MPHSARLRKVGGSIMLSIPPALLDALDLRADASVGMSVKSGKLMVEPEMRPRYTLEELLGQCDAKAPIDKHDSEWLEAPATGRELI